MRVILQGVTLLIVTGLFTGLPLAGFAQDSPSKAKNLSKLQDSFFLDELVVTATRSEKEMGTAPAAVSVVTKEELEAFTFSGLDEALRYEAGYFDGKLRGLPSAGQTLLMLNGMPLNSGWFGGHRWDNVGVENVERIEIVRGPASALYGGNAMGGTINVITKMPDQFEAGVKTRFGSDDNLSYSGYIGNRVGEKFSFRLGFERDEELYGYPNSYVQRSSIQSGSGDLNGGFFMKTRTNKPAWIVGDTGDRHEDQWGISFASKYELSDTGSIRLEAQMESSFYEYDPPHTYIADVDGNPVFDGKVDVGDGEYVTIAEKYYLSAPRETINSSYMATYSETFGPLSFLGKFGYQHEDMWYTTAKAATGEGYRDAGGNVKEFDTDTFFADMQFNFDIGDRHHITTGVYGRYNGFDQGQFDVAYYQDEDSKISGKTELTQGKDQYSALYIQEEFEAIKDAVTIYAGIRADFWSASDGKSGSAESPTILDDVDNSAVSPKLSWVWTLSRDTIVKGSIGRAFRPPTIYDLYRTYNSGSRMVYSNPDLDSETILNYEIGVVKYFIGRRIKTEVMAFNSDIDNLIYTYDDEDGNSRKDNAGEARIRGIELGASIIPFDALSIWANYTYNDTEITKQDKDPEMVGKKITAMPDQTINVGANYAYNWLTINLAGRYTGRIYKTEYNTDIPNVYQGNSTVWIWETKLIADIPYESPYFKDVQISLSVENLFDEEYYDYYIGRERSYFVEFKLNW